jgi:hypothetical protein
MVTVKSLSPIGFSRLGTLWESGYTAVESDYAGIAPSTSTLHGKALAYELTRASLDSFEYRVYRLDPKDKDPVNVDLYRLTRTESFASLEGPTKPSSGHHLPDLPTHVWNGLPSASFHFPVVSSTAFICSSASPYTWQTT